MYSKLRIPKQLTRNQLDDIKRQMGVHLDELQRDCKQPNQRFAIYNRRDDFVADVTAKQLFFEEAELRMAILETEGKRFEG